MKSLMLTCLVLPVSMSNEIPYLIIGLLWVIRNDKLLEMTV